LKKVTKSAKQVTKLTDSESLYPSLHFDI